MDQLAELARDLPKADLDRVASLLAEIQDSHSGPAKSQLLQAIAHGAFRHKASELLAAWSEERPDLSGEALAFGLRAAAWADDARARRESIDLVWTGPTTLHAPFRRIDQALLELIKGSQSELWVICFAVNKVPDIMQALGDAVARSVDLHLVLESSEESEGKLSFDLIEPMKASFSDKARLYVWPSEKRPVNEDGKQGTLHAKCALADGSHLLVSSANLTEFAMNLNMEMGLLVEGKSLGGRVAQHFRGLVESGVLSRV